MKKYLDKLKCNIYINKNLFVFLLVIVIIGVISGSLFSIIMSSSDKSLVMEYINNFFNSLKEGKLNYNNNIINSLFFTILFAILIWLLGISVIGFFIVLFLLFLKAFILGFTTSSIIYSFKLKGLLYGLIYVFPHQVINLFVFMLLSAYALIVSFKVIRCFSGKRVLDFRNIFKWYLIVLIFSLVCLVLTSLYEIYGMPKLLNIVLTILK